MIITTSYYIVVEVAAAAVGLQHQSGHEPCAVSTPGIHCCSEIDCYYCCSEVHYTPGCHMANLSLLCWWWRIMSLNYVCTSAVVVALRCAANQTLQQLHPGVSWSGYYIYI